MEHRRVPRSLARRIVDRQWAKYVGLPPETGEYTIQRLLRIPMRDGVELLADLFEPQNPHGTIVTTSPYGWNLLGSAMNGGIFACRGYRVLFVRCRGTFGSGGTFEPFRHEVDDGADIVEWMRHQDWWDGRFATFGYSYLGFTQWALLMDPPPELATAVIACAPFDFGGFAYTGGSFLLSTLFEWSFLTARQERPIIPLIVGNLAAKGAIARALDTVPLLDASPPVLKESAPWYSEWVGHRPGDEPWWRPTDLSGALERVGIPVLLQTGWQDGFLRQVIAAHSRLSQRGVPVALTVGPWTHAEGGGAGARVLLPDALAWFGEQLAGGPPRESPVKVRVGGQGDEWRSGSSWPLADAERAFYPGPDHVLGDRQAAVGISYQFTYDPVHPTPTFGGAFVTSLSPGYRAGYVSDDELGQRADVICLTSDPLTDGLELLGSPVAYLDHRSSTPFCDLFVRVSDVDPDGASRNVSDGFLRLDGMPPGPVRITASAPATGCAS